ncbi:bifunctional adenosylcobinamide kinase/adenosylcobinamide-phosphate guanylyltransferase [Pseudobutyrivibrio sp.]|uniref:bifunctional adenosylcobinamide kinase/adenosylcobinamide-phosphate guanylyltransferase n=1 Tax=Pseudobutyrivibrio sp. TaxID=2014367 RepID=UPI00386343BC
MITLIYGGSSSGKSSYAEDYVCKSNYKNKYYLATMVPYDEESKERVKRHRELRAGKDFVTLEHSVDITDAIPEVLTVDSGDFSTDSRLSQEDIILLECMSNLVANEMFRDGQVFPSDYCIKKIMEDVKELHQKVKNIVIVTNNVFEDSAEYDEGTKDYLRALGKINQNISALADEVYEVVVGIAIPIKEKGRVL